MKYKIKYATISNCGDREINEDSIGVFTGDKGCCFVLCDGLGGHGMGDVASSIVKESFGKVFAAEDNTLSFFDNAFSISQEILLQEQARKNAKKKMKTTCVCIVTDNKKAYIGYIGDSRAYIFNKNKVKKRTLDHSIPQMLAIRGEIKECEIRNHPERNTLLRVMGVEWEERMFEVIEPVALRKSQAFLLCSDGFWELIEEDEMCQLLEKAETVDEWLYTMTDVVKENGKGRNMDNYSAIAVWI